MATARGDVLAEDFSRAAEFLAGDDHRDGGDKGTGSRRHDCGLSTCAPETPLFSGRLATGQLSCGSFELLNAMFRAPGP